MTTQTKAADPMLPPLPEARIVSYQIDSVMRREELRTYGESDMQDYGRACYEKARADLLAEMQPVLKAASDELRSCADELKQCHTIGGKWDGSEVEAHAEYLRLNALAELLTKE